MPKSVKFRWNNYKCFMDTGWLDIKPITILLGSNGSGKSSIIQPLLLLAQTLESADTSMSLMPTGEYLKAGSFSDLVNNHNDKLSISFEFDFTKQDIINSATPKKKLGTCPPTKAKIEFRPDTYKMPLLQSLELKDCYNRQMFYRELEANNKYSLSYLEELDMKDEYSQDIYYQQPTHFMFSESDIISKALFNSIKSNSESRSKNKITFTKEVSEYIGQLGFFNSSIKKLLKSVKYIGPLREHPKRYYEYSGEYHSQVGSKGEYTYSMLYQLLKDDKNKKLLYKWLNNFGLIKEIHCGLLQNKPDLLEIYSLNANRKIKINYADTCFGVSQILPLLVQSIMANNNDIVITEQPEIHLNPNCETILADFFVEMISSKNVRFIIETHSEHYFLRLRKHIKTGLIDANDVAVYMVDKTKDTSVVKKIAIDSSGNFNDNDWPNGFFEQALSESLMFATAKKVTHV